MRSFSAIAGRLLTPLGKITAGVRGRASKVPALLPWLRSLRVELWMAEGQQRGSGLPLTVVLAVSETDRNYLLSLIFGNRCRQRRLGRHWMWDIARVIRKEVADCAMAFTWICPSQMKLVLAHTSFLIPDWVLGEVAIPLDDEGLANVQDELLKIEQHRLRFKVTRDPVEFDDFYHHMYVPYINKTCADRAVIEPYETLKKLFQDNDLVLVVSQRGSIAGQLIVYEQGRRRPHLMLMAVRDGNPEHTKAGAGDALYHHSFQHLHEKGFRKVTVGWSRSFLRDGILRFKHKWSQKIVRGGDWGFGLRIVSLTPAVRFFLLNNPFIFKRKGRMHAAVFVDSRTPLQALEIGQIHKEYLHAGLSGLEIYRLPQEGECPAPPLPTDELPERVLVRAWRP